MFPVVRRTRRKSSRLIHIESFLETVQDSLLSRHQVFGRRAPPLHNNLLTDTKGRNYGPRVRPFPRHRLTISLEKI